MQLSTANIVASRNTCRTIAQNPLVPAFGSTACPFLGPRRTHPTRVVRGLHHSLLSAPLNLGLITARETCEAALRAWAAADGAIPLQSVEGFVRQLLGWREFIRHVYRRRMPELHGANRLGAAAPLPDFYWTGETRMRCVGEAVRGVLANGHAHHIERLMVLGNWALLAGVEPRQVNDWFLEAFVDAFDWVVSQIGRAHV